MADRIIRELELLKLYCDDHEEEDLRFRAFLKGRINLSEAELDAVVHETTDEVWKGIDCTTCANCCRTMTTPVDDEDIQRLAKRLEMTPEQFSERYVEDADRGERQLSGLPCVFLGSDNRCTVYEDRPLACHEYPFLYKDDFRGRTLGVIGNAAVCPIVFNVWQRLKRRLWTRTR